jgi:hypothetical protein
MAPTASDLHRDRHLLPSFQPAAHAVITDARGATSAEISTRVRRYTYAMAFRLACFLSMAFVEGWLRWTLLAFAVFLPYVAVVLANQADQRTGESQVEHGAPEGAPALPARAEVVTGDATVIEGEVIEGEVIGGEVIRGEVVREPDEQYLRPAA